MMKGLSNILFMHLYPKHPKSRSGFWCSHKVLPTSESTKTEFVLQSIRTSNFLFVFFRLLSIQYLTSVMHLTRQRTQRFPHCDLGDIISAVYDY